MAIIGIKNLKISAIIGTLEHERVNKQDVIINIEFEYDATRAAESDNFMYALDYQKLKNGIEEFVENSEFYLLEKLTQEVINFIMEDDRIENALVRIEKPAALENTDSVFIELYEER